MYGVGTKVPSGRTGRAGEVATTAVEVTGTGVVTTYARPGRATKRRARSPALAVSGTRRSGANAARRSSERSRRSVMDGNPSGHGHRPRATEVGTSADTRADLRESYPTFSG